MTMSAITPSRVSGYLLVAWFASSRLGRLRQPLLRDQLYRQISAVGISALPVIAVLAVLTGATVVTQVTALAGTDQTLAQRLLFYGLLFELAPLLSALVIVARSSAAIASELAVMHLHDEFVALRRLGIDAAEFLLLPRILGLTIALPAVTVVFQAVALTSGWLALALWQNTPVLEVAGQFLESASIGLTLLCLLKSALTGALVGIIATHHGSSSAPTSQAISGAAIQAVGSGLVATFLVDAAIALVVFYWQ